MRDDSITILIDSREQLPYKFTLVESRIKYVHKKTVHLETGDYSVEICGATGNKQRIAIERKTLADLYTTLTGNRRRFIREAERMKEYGYAAIVIEADMLAIHDPNAHLDHPTRASPASIFGTLFALSERYNIAIWTCPNREFAEIVTLRLLERWHRDINDGDHAFAKIAMTNPESKPRTVSLRQQGRSA